MATETHLPHEAYGPTSMGLQGAGLHPTIFLFSVEQMDSYPLNPKCLLLCVAWSAGKGRPGPQVRGQEPSFPVQAAVHTLRPNSSLCQALTQSFPTWTGSEVLPCVLHSRQTAAVLLYSCQVSGTQADTGSQASSLSLFPRQSVPTWALQPSTCGRHCPKGPSSSWLATTHTSLTLPASSLPPSRPPAGSAVLPSLPVPRAESGCDNISLDRLTLKKTSSGGCFRAESMA